MRKLRFSALTFSGRFEPVPISPKPEPVPEPVPEHDGEDQDDGREVALRGLFDLEPAEPVPPPASASPSILARPRRRRRASGAIAFRMPTGDGQKVVLRATVTAEVKTVVMSIEDENRRERAYVVLGPGKLGVLVSLLGGLAKLAGTELDLGSIHAPARVPLAWAELERRRSR